MVILLDLNPLNHSLLVSCTVIQYKDKIYLLDVGEGSLGQMFRNFGPQGIEKALQKLQFIYISHLHADHHLGIFNILKMWKKLVSLQAKLLIVAPREFWTWILEYSDIEDVGLQQLVFIKSEDLYISEQEIQNSFTAQRNMQVFP